MQTNRGRLTAVRGVLLMTVLCAFTIGCSGRARSVDRFYGIVNSPAADGKLVSIDVRDQNDVTITPIGTIGTFGCTSVALSKEGTLYSICGPANFADTQHKYGCMTPGPQQLANIDPKTGHATMFGAPVEKLNVMALEFAPDGTLYASALRSDSVFRIAPDGSRSVAARGLSAPWALAYTPDGTLYVVDADRATLNRVAADGSVTPVRLSAPM